MVTASMVEMLLPLRSLVCRWISSRDSPKTCRRKHSISSSKSPSRQFMTPSQPTCPSHSTAEPPAAQSSCTATGSPQPTLATREQSWLTRSARLLSSRRITSPIRRKSKIGFSRAEVESFRGRPMMAGSLVLIECSSRARIYRDSRCLDHLETTLHTVSVSRMNQWSSTLNLILMYKS